MSELGGVPNEAPAAECQEPAILEMNVNPGLPLWVFSPDVLGNTRVLESEMASVGH